MRTFVNIMKWMLLVVIVSIAIVSMIMVAGEDIADRPMSIAEFFGLKLLAIILLAGCYFSIRILYKKNLLPE